MKSGSAQAAGPSRSANCGRPVHMSQSGIFGPERLTQPAREYGMGRHFSEAEDAIAAFNELRRQAN